MDEIRRYPLSVSMNVKGSCHLTYIREWATDALVLECRKETRPVVPGVTTGERGLVVAQNGRHGDHAPWWFSVRLTSMTRAAMAFAMRVVRRRHVR